MIVSNKQSSWGNYAEPNTTGFDFFVSTAPRNLSGSILAIPTDVLRKSPGAKAWLNRKPTKIKRERVHDYICAGLDQTCNKGTQIICAAEGTLSVAKARGLIDDYIIDKRR